MKTGYQLKEAMMNQLDNAQVESLLATAAGNVSYQSQYARTTAIVRDGRWLSKQFARDYLDTLLDAERKAAYVTPATPTVSGIRSQPYTGPFPRGKHSHKCKGCEQRGQYAVACYKSKCAKPQLVATCEFCAAYYRGGK
jgi:hypothetical protein